MKLFLFTIVALLLALQSMPQYSQHLIRVSEENGLSDNHVRCVWKDRQGFVWIGTADGLNLMDGSQIISFRHREGDSTSLPANEINCITQDAAGQLWIGTSKGLAKYNAATHNFSSFICPESHYGDAINIKSIAIDANQHLYCGTYGGLYDFDAQKHVFSALANTSEGDKINANHINQVLLDSGGLLWLCTTDGLWSYDPRSSNFARQTSAANDRYYDATVATAIEDHAGNIWFGCWNSGLEKLDRQTGRVVGYELPAKDRPRVTAITETRSADGHYTIWLNGRMLAFDPETAQYYHYLDPSNYPDIPELFPRHCSRDKWVWMGSDKGLFIFRPQNAAFQHRAMPGFTASQNICLLEKGDQLLIASEGKYFCRLYDNEFKVAKDYSYALNSFPYPNQAGGLSALSLLNAGDNVMMGTSNGLLQLNLISGKTAWWLQQPPDSIFLHRHFITALFHDHAGRYWLFPWRGGIWQADTASHSMHEVWEGFISENERKKKLLIAGAAEDSIGNIWMADLDEGIVKYEVRSGRFTKPLAALIGDRCQAKNIYFRNGNFYAVINNVLTKWSPDLKSFQRFPLPNDMQKAITDCIPDKKGRWWMATRSGLMCFNEKTGNTQRFTEADGLITNDMDGALLCRSNGQIVFAEAGFVTSFDPDKLTEGGASTPVAVFTGMEKNGQPVSLTEKGEFPYNANNLFFRWTVTDYSDPFHNQFYCMLKGIDKRWRFTGNRGEVQYANLSPGSYELLLRGSTANGLDSRNILSVPFVIHAPFWKTAWFITASLLLITALIYFWYRYRLQQALKVERLRSKISTDLHDDIGSTLSSISILSNIASREHDSKRYGGMMEEISGNAVLLMEKMDDIVWSINPKNDSLENLMQRVLRFATRLFEARNIDYKINIEDNIASIKLPMEYRQHIYLIMKEAINNLVKYAGATEASIQVSHKNNLLKVCITDNGIGFDVNQPFTGNGLLSMQQRARQMSAALELHSQPGLGTNICLSVKIK